MMLFFLKLFPAFHFSFQAKPWLEKLPLQSGLGYKYKVLLEFFRNFITIVVVFGAQDNFAQKASQKQLRADDHSG